MNRRERFKGFALAFNVVALPILSERGELDGIELHGRIVSRLREKFPKRKRMGEQEVLARMNSLQEQGSVLAKRLGNQRDLHKTYFSATDLGKRKLAELACS